MPSSWSIAYGIYTNGEAPIVLSYGTSPVYHLISESTERYQALVLDDVAWAQIEGAGIVKGSKNPELAKAALDYLLSIPMQEALPESQFMYPVRVDAKLPESFKIAAQASEILNPRLDLGDVRQTRFMASGLGERHEIFTAFDRSFPGKEGCIVKDLRIFALVLLVVIVYVPIVGLVVKLAAFPTCLNSLRNC